MNTTTRPTRTERRDAAREKARAMRKAQEVKDRRRRRELAGAAVAAVLVVVVGVGALVQSGRSSVDEASTAPGDIVDGAFVTGTTSAPVTVSIYYDYLCPACRSFEQAQGEWLSGLRDAGEVAVEYRPISILDRYSSTAYSTRSANAAACVADSSPEAFQAFHDEMFVVQPPEGGEGLPDGQLVRIARDAGAGEAVEQCVADGQFSSWVATTTDQASQDGVRGTPTVLVDGVMVPNPTREALETAISAASARAS